MPENKAGSNRKDKEQTGKDQKLGFAAAVVGGLEGHAGDKSGTLAMLQKEGATLPHLAGQKVCAE